MPRQSKLVPAGRSDASGPRSGAQGNAGGLGSCVRRKEPSMRPRSTVLLASLVVAVTAGMASAARAGSATRRLSLADSGAVERARSGATKLLQRPECQQLFTDFNDGQGRVLRERLEESGLGVSDYLRTILFFDGALTRSCRRSEVLLVASPGARTVAVCPAEGTPVSRLARVERRDPWFAKHLVIHEMLHTLGLGEDPPRSQQITRQVQKRCRP
jgi:hypothetical protein